MAKVLKFILMWLWIWIGYGLIYVAVYTYDTIKLSQRHWYSSRTHGPLGLPHLWELAIVVVICGVAAAGTSRMRSQPGGRESLNGHRSLA